VKAAPLENFGGADSSRIAGRKSDAAADCQIACPPVHRRVAPSGIALGPTREMNLNQSGHTAVRASHGNAG
jgi:hypothetical protein